jgi:hypothetical protein
MVKENIFKKRKRNSELLRKGYLFAVLFSLLFAGRAVYYHYYIRSELYREDYIRLLINSFVNFIAMLLVTLLATRWYYKMKDKQNGN